MKGFITRVILLLTLIFVGLMALSGAVGRALPYEDEIRYMTYSTNEMNLPDNLIAHMLDIRRGVSVAYGDPLPTGGGSWSPDGRYFVRRLANSTIISDGETSREIFPGDVSPIWSPNGDHLIFEVRGLGIYAANGDGTNPHQITPDVGEYYTPQYSPDGTRLLMLGNRNNIEIYISGIEGEDLHPITSNFENEINPAWSPDGRHIAFLRSTPLGLHIMMMDADGQNEIDLTPELRNAADFYWSPDGTRLAFTYVLEGEGSGIQVYVVNIDGTAPQPLSALAPANDIRLFGWSPDGRHLVVYRIDFMSSSGGRQPHTDLVDASTGILWRQIYGGMLSFSPDGQSTAYIDPYGQICIQQLVQLTERCFSTLPRQAGWLLWLSLE